VGGDEHYKEIIEHSRLNDKEKAIRVLEADINEFANSEKSIRSFFI